ncbi:MAG: DEAD/DEAH box helicase [Candidatus Altiarchaeota archaeon]
MLFRELDIADEFKNIIDALGVERLYPPQEDAVKAGILEKKNLILCTPTASGKTLTAELAIMKALESGGKAVYIVPLRALAYEKYVEFRKYEQLGYKVRLEVGDLDSSKYKRKPAFDIIVATAEKCDSILRSRPRWFQGTSVLVLDEIHLIASDRGPVYEVLTAKFRNIYPDVQVLGLSATIGNAGELAEWLNADLLQSDWRPVKLNESVVVREDESLGDVVASSVAEGQVLVFVNSRRSAEAVAEKLGNELNLASDSERLGGIAEEVLDALGNPTRQCKRLAECVRRGTAFHHAGLVNKQRILIEDAFKEGLVKVISATPTLAAGVNLPARTVVVRDVKRFTQNGMAYIPVLEYKQQVGRAGRPKYDKVGDAITIASSSDEAGYIDEHYVHGEPEDIHSQLGIKPVLRFHSLASIASSFTRTSDALIEFFRATFFGFQYGVRSEFESMINEIVSELVEWGFVKTENRFLAATELGARVSELYIDPMTAHNYLELLNKAEEGEKFSELGLLEVLSDAVEIIHLPVKHKEEAVIWEEAYRVEDELLRDLGGFDLDFQFLNRFKTAKMFVDWVNEKTEDGILEDYNVTPGQLNMRLQNLEWLCYAASELTRITKLRKSHVELSRLGVRIKYGVRKELLPLVAFKEVGRVRARKLFRDGLKTPSDLKKASLTEMADIVGLKTARKIKSQLAGFD